MAKNSLQIILIIMGICMFSLIQHVLAQDNSEQIIPITPTPVVFPPPRFARPELICPYFSNLQNGYEWRDITIGVSTQEDLENTLAQFGDYEIITPYEGTLANAIRYQWNESTRRGEEQQAPFAIDVCFQDSIITVLDVSTRFLPSMRIEDFVSNLGQPDIVTWSSVENNRTVFWFEEGIAANVFVQRGDGASFGRIGAVFYFPPQSSEGYETRWPFNITRMQPFNHPDSSIPNEQNPFDFDAIIATITAQPSLTPIPTNTEAP